jgi:hypothetical protein
MNANEISARVKAIHSLNWLIENSPEGRYSKLEQYGSYGIPALQRVELEALAQKAVIRGAKKLRKKLLKDLTDAGISFS